MIEIAWAAGLYDGEGSTFFKLGKRGRSYGRLHATVTQNHDTRVLERIHAALGVGKIYGPYKGHNEQYQWRAHHREALEALRIMWPYLSGPKREQAEMALATYNESLVGRRPYRGSDREVLVLV